VKRFLFLLMFALALTAPMTAVAQDAPVQPPADANPLGSDQTRGAPTGTESLPRALRLTPPRAGADQSLGALAPTETGDLGDWSNTAALACILPLGAVYNFSFGASLVAKPPPLDFPPTMAAFSANLALKYCAPWLEPPPDQVVADEGSCQAEFVQTRTSGKYSNILGSPSPFGDLYYGKQWGEIGTPDVLHWSTQVDVSVSYPGSYDAGSSRLTLPVGLNLLTWRGTTLIHPLDYIPIYIPGLGADRELLRTVLNGVVFVGDKVIRFASPAYPNPAGIYNTESQRIAVTDFVRPTISASMDHVAVEAIEPGGVTRRTLLSAIRPTITFGDNCDVRPTLTPAGVPDFAPVGDSFEITWTVRDHGPHDLNGGYNENSLVQTVTIADTKPPIVLAPPSIVTETATLPAAVALGQPAVFDLADLKPAVSNDALLQPGVVAGPDGPRFPAGKTTVTWTAEDDAGNRTTVTQLVNVKTPGSNHTPVAQSQSGGDAVDAISFEPVTITVQADDTDLDPLWFSVENQPENGFFHAPLLPYFIQDYRLANFQDISFLDYCADPDHRSEYVPTNWPVDAAFMAVADDGTTYVHDQGLVRCGFDGAVYADYRIAVFRPDGTWISVPSSFDMKNMYVDWRNGYLFATYHNVGGTFDWIRQYDLDLNLVDEYRMDDADPSFREPTQGFIDQQGIIYVTDGFIYRGAAKLQLYDANAGENPVLLADYSLPGVVWNDLALDSEGYLYASAGKQTGNTGINRVFKFSPASFDAEGAFHPGELIGWLGKCDYGPGCDVANGRSFGFSCLDDTLTDTPTCGVDADNFGTAPGQFHSPRGIALDPNDILYVTDYYNRRVQRFTPDGLFAGQAVSECDGSCFVLGDFGSPEDVTVNSDHFYVLDDEADLLHVFQTSTINSLRDDAATIVYQSENNFVGTDRFTFGATDGLATSDAVTVEIAVSRNYRPPLADRGLTFTTAEDTPLDLPLSGYDPDEQLDTLTYRVDTPPAHGTISGVEPDRLYTPDPDYVGTDTFTFVVDDGKFLSAPELVTVTMTPVNDAPRFVSTNEGGPAGFAVRVAGAHFDLSRLTTLDEMQIGRGFKTVFSVDFYDPDAFDNHMVAIDWDDGSPVEQEGKLLEDGTITGPLLTEGRDGGTGSVYAEHIFEENGSYAVEVCITDNVIVDENGDKTTSAASVTACDTIDVTVSSMADILLEITESSDPTPTGEPLTYTLDLINNPPEQGSGVTATGLVVTGTLDPRLEWQYANSASGTCDQADGIITCRLDPLAPGETATVEVGVTLGAKALPGDVLEYGAAYRLNEPTQADDQRSGETTTVVAPADYIVNTVEDEPDAETGDGTCATIQGRCTLRAAVAEANAQPGRQTIALGYETYGLDGALLLQDDTVIVGLGADRTVLAAKGDDRVLSVTGGPVIKLTDLRITGGAVEGPGGGLHNSDGSVTLERVQVSGNTATGPGGGLYNESGTLTLVDSAVTANRSEGSGGGLHNAGSAALQNVTLSGNQAASGGGLSDQGTASLANVTVSANHATGSGGGIYGGPETTLHDTLVAGNSADDAAPDCGDTITSQGTNLIQDTSDCTILGQTASNITGRDPLLAPPELNGARTLSFALRLHSPAVDAGSCTLSTDQRGIERPQGNGCDIGAFELEPAALYLPLIVH
jgi:CSLREA domain-containing protein